MPTIDQAKIKAAVLASKQVYEDGINAAGVDCDFTLRTGQQFTIRGVIKYQAEQSMTDGVNQDRRRLTVAADTWDALAPAGQMPFKGDRVNIDGSRFAVMEADPVRMSDVKVVYRMRLTG